MSQKQWRDLGRALEKTPMNRMTDQKAQDNYGRTLSSKPDLLLFHGSRSSNQASKRFKGMEADIGNLAELHEIEDTTLLVYEDEFNWLEEDFNSLADDYNLDLEVSDLNPYPGAEDWIPVMETEAQNIRSYTSRSNRDKLNKVGQYLMPDRKIVTFGFEDESDSTLRFYLGKADYLRQKNAVKDMK